MTKPTKHFGASAAQTPVNADTKTKIIQDLRDGLNRMQQDISNFIAQNPQFSNYSLSVIEEKTPKGGRPILSIITTKNNEAEPSAHAVRVVLGNKKMALRETNPSEKQVRGVSTNTSRFMMLGQEYNAVHTYKLAPAKSYPYAEGTAESILKDINRLVIERCLPTGFATGYHQSRLAPSATSP